MNHPPTGTVLIYLECVRKRYVVAVFSVCQSEEVENFPLISVLALSVLTVFKLFPDC
ncbi:hypothetical protein HTH_0436 [Hydrogenobacter thermophilus TK-6]|uniref:Uncharacterized protein n=1 Tax=Hydrogenobacter thermophilus (strain DSM 6534 / IAM 12695 / TK-6) TaxID=608538 RepID=D3DGE8_HYDTT|nr:hypothetical protein HTH_0436 [Hydrogenobacter thermophilus TK-6]